MARTAANRRLTSQRALQALAAKRQAASTSNPRSHSASSRAHPFKFTKPHEAFIAEQITFPGRWEILTGQKSKELQHRSKRDVHIEVTTEFNKNFTTSEQVMDLSETQIRNKIDSILRIYSNELIFFKSPASRDLPEDGSTLEELMLSKCHYFYILYQASFPNDKNAAAKKSYASSSTGPSSTAVQQDMPRVQNRTGGERNPSHVISFTRRPTTTAVSAINSNLNQQIQPEGSSKHTGATQINLEATLELVGQHLEAMMEIANKNYEINSERHQWEIESRNLEIEERRQRIEKGHLDIEEKQQRLLKGEVDLKRSRLELEERMIEVEERKRKLNSNAIVTPNSGPSAIYNFDCRTKSLSPTTPTSSEINLRYG
ncbi:hypothetical protein BGZ76_003932 [Entomortierella beljakovae]|nr:hypothetical protein BGZ76_003932 [Entomortierella beljakovae]